MSSLLLTKIEKKQKLNFYDRQDDKIFQDKFRLNECFDKTINFESSSGKDNYNITQINTSPKKTKGTLTKFRSPTKETQKEKSYVLNSHSSPPITTTMIFEASAKPPPYPQERKLYVHSPKMKSSYSIGKGNAHSLSAENTPTKVFKC